MNGTNSPAALISVRQSAFDFKESDAGGVLILLETAVPAHHEEPASA